AVRPVVHEHEAALILVNEQRLAVAFEDEALAEAGVIVPVVVRDLLVVPLELAGVGVESKHGRSIEIVARTCLAPVVVWSWVSGAPEHEVPFGVVGTGHPAAATTEFPGVAGPAFRVILDGVELPRFLTGSRIESEDLALDREFPRGLTQDDLVLDHERGASEVAAALLGIDELRSPHLLAGLHVKGDDPSVKRAEEHLAMAERD